MKIDKKKIKSKISVLGLSLATGMLLFGNGKVLGNQKVVSLEKDANVRYISVSLEDLSESEKEKLVRDKIDNIKADEDDICFSFYSK